MMMVQPTSLTRVNKLRSFLVLCFGFIALIAFESAAQPPQVEQDLAEEAQDARDAWVSPDIMGDIYAEHCAVCHGDNLQGKAIGPSLLSEDYSHGDSIADIIASIATGYPDKGMPAWQAVLSAEEIKGLTVFILEKRLNMSMDAFNGLGERPAVPKGIQTSSKHRFTLREIRNDIVYPYSIAPLPDGRILLTEKAKGLSIVASDGSDKTLVRDGPKVFDDGVLRGSTLTGSGWVHDVELHPNYKKNGWIYLSHGHRCDACNKHSIETGEPVVMVQLLRARLDGDRWVDQEIIWRADPEVYVAGIEVGVGARITFDKRGYVYLSLGNLHMDQSGVQDLDKPFGKVLRLHDDGRIPTDNPFVGRADALPEIWTLGHRNPQGLSYDRHANILWEAEHGPRGGDEANILQPGLNYGWPLVSLGVDYDGLPIRYGKKLGIEFDPADLEPTVIDWTPSLGVSNITFYQNAFKRNKFAKAHRFDAWKNHMLVSTLGANDLLRYELDGRQVVESEVLVNDIGRIRDVEVNWRGDIVLLIEHSLGSSIVLMERAP